jgi:hypothetical protein
MNALLLTHQNAYANVKPNTSARRVRAELQTLGAVIGLLGSVLSASMGSLLTATGWFVANKDVQQWLSTTGSVLLYLTIPLIVLAAYCLDWMEKREPQ